MPAVLNGIERFAALHLVIAAGLLTLSGGRLHGGRRLLGQAMPTVVLAARWGLTGFWICAGFGYLCAVTTLSAALSGLIGAMRGGGHKGGLLTALAMAALTGLLGIRRTVGVSYPVVSWLCAALMLSLACRADALLFRSGKG